MSEDDTALTPLEVAEKLKIAKNTVYELIKRGELQGYRVGKKVRVDLKAVEAYKQRDRKAPLEADYVADPAGGPKLRSSLVICGQDMILDVLAQHLERAFPGFQSLRSYLGSYNGVFALYQDQVDVATAHLWDAESDQYNLPYIKRMLPGVPTVLVNLAKRPVGFYVRQGNPKNIQDWSVLKKRELRLVNRELGSGMRVLLDQKIRLAGLDLTQINGYGNYAPSHLAAASAVARGDGDYSVGNEKSASQVKGVDFVFLHWERYDLIFKENQLTSPGIQKLLKVLRSFEYRQDLEGLGGYDLTDLGKEVGRT